MSGHKWRFNQCHIRDLVYFFSNHVHAEKHRNNPCLDKKERHKSNMDNGLGGKKITDIIRLRNCTLSIPEARSRCFLHISNQPCINVNGLFSVYNVTSWVSSFRSYLKSALVLRLSFIESPVIVFFDKYMKFS